MTLFKNFKIFFSKQSHIFSGPSDDSETASKRPKLDFSLTSAPKVDKVGTVNPSEDFLALLQSGLSFASIVVQLEDVIFRLFTESFEDSFIQKGNFPYLIRTILNI